MNIRVFKKKWQALVGTWSAMSLEKVEVDIRTWQAMSLREPATCAAFSTSKTTSGNSWFALCLALALVANTSHAATPTISSAQYEAQLRGARTKLEQLESKPARDVRPVLKSLETDRIVKRIDGKTQLASGDEWAKRLAVPRDGVDNSKLTRTQLIELERALERHLKAFKVWDSPRNGAYFQSADAQKFVSQLEKSGQIRVAPHWWQTLIANGWRAVGDAWTALWKWIGSLFPTPKAPTTNVTQPDLSWLWFVFWAFALALLALLLFLAYRLLRGRALFRRNAKSDEFQGEDAELLQLPPDELRERAERFAANGQFREALRHRFIAVLVRFDRHGVWRYDVRRTNWEHISALKRDESKRALVEPLSDIMRRFDRVRYGGDDCDLNGWQRFDEDAFALENAAGVPDSRRALAGASR